MGIFLDNKLTLTYSIRITGLIFLACLWSNSVQNEHVASSYSRLTKVSVKSNLPVFLYDQNCGWTIRQDKAAAAVLHLTPTPLLKYESGHRNAQIRRGANQTRAEPTGLSQPDTAVQHNGNITANISFQFHPVPIHKYQKKNLIIIFAINLCNPSLKVFHV